MASLCYQHIGGNIYTAVTRPSFAYLNRLTESTGPPSAKNHKLISPGQKKGSLNLTRLEICGALFDSKVKGPCYVMLIKIRCINGKCIIPKRNMILRACSGMEKIF